MGGGLMQLVAYGAQDIYLTGNPQITFFKVVYRRHTNFSMESIEQTLSGTVGFGNKVTSTVSRNGDLIHKVYAEFTKGSSNTFDANGCANFGSAVLEEVELEIGGQRIDNARLELTADQNLNIYAVNYNVLRIMSGMGGLAYSN